MRFAVSALNEKQQALNEWSLGKAETITNKLFALITKKTNIKYAVIGVPQRYTCEWGKFQGFYVISSDKKTYRVNFSVGKTEEIVSIDRFNRGDEFTNFPAETLSLEGYGIGKVFNQILDFMKGYLSIESQKLVESVSLKEGVYGDLLAGFLKDNPQWVDDFRDGSYDSKKLKQEVDAYCKEHGYDKYTSLSYILATVKNILLKNPGVASNVPQAKAAANGIALATVVPGKQGVVVIDALPPEMEADFAAFEKMMASEEVDGPQAVIEGYRTAIEYMLNNPDDTQAAIVAFGRAGTGKTYHAQDVLAKLGYTQGLTYDVCNSKVAGGTEGLISVLYKDREMPVVVFDDCDNVLRSADAINVFKNVLQDTGRRYVAVKTPVQVPGGDKITADFDVESKFIFCTNLQAAQIDAAVRSRAKFFEFNFTDEEIVEMMKDSLKNIFSDVPDLSEDDKLYVYQWMRGAVQRGYIVGVSFRSLNEAIRCFLMCKRLGRAFKAEIAKLYKQLNKLSVAAA